MTLQKKFWLMFRQKQLTKPIFRNGGSMHNIQGDNDSTKKLKNHIAIRPFFNIDFSHDPM